MHFVLEEWKEFMGNCAILATVCQIFSGVLVCKNYIKNKSTADSSPLPFIAGFLSSSLWFQYGLQRNDEKIILINTIGVTLFLIYVGIFLYYAFKKSFVLKQFLAVVMFVLFIYAYGIYTEDKKLFTNRLGLLSCSLALLFVAAPLTKLYYVVRVKNTACLPFPMIFMALVTSLLWWLYGIIINDPYLQLPNLIGASLAAFQLSLFFIYPAVPRSPTSIKTMNL